jgi:hypothetical protein
MNSIRKGTLRRNFTYEKAVFIGKKIRFGEMADPRIPSTLSPDSRLALLLSLNLVQKQPSRARAEMEWALTSHDHIY